MKIPDDTNELLTIPEGKTFDRKSSKYELNKLANILIAFANSDGGTVALGIRDKKFEGIKLLSSKKQNDFLQVGMQLVVPTLDVKIEKIKIMNDANNVDEVWLLSVDPAEDKIYANKKDEVYLRSGDETHKVTYEERKKLEFDKSIRVYEKQAVNDALIEDIDPDALNEYKKMYNFSGESIWDLLFPKGLAKREIDGNQKISYKLTVAGVLLLAKTPTAFIPGARIRFIRYEGREAKTGSDMNIVRQSLIEGPLPKMLTQVSAEVESQLRDFTSLNLTTGKFMDVPEYPKGAWLEGIVNAVTHRSYNYTGDDIRIIMFDDRIQIHSPGGLPAVVTTENIRKTHYSRNPYIARALTDFGWVREFGEGVDRIYKDMNEFFLDDPVYQVESSSVDLILKNNIIIRSFRKNNDLEARIGEDWDDLNFIEQKAIGIAYEHGSVKTREVLKAVENYSETSVRNALKHLSEIGIFERVATAPTSPKQYYKLIK